MKTNNAFCSICTVNYAAYAATLNDSLKKAGHTEPHYVLIVDYNDKYREIIEKFNFTPVFLKELEVPGIDELIEKYSAFELCNVLRPFLMDWLLKNKDINILIYLDTDIYVYTRLNKVFDLLEKDNYISVVLTPHLCDYDEYIKVSNYKLERTFLKFGLYNSGFYVLKNDVRVLKFLDWLKIKLFDYCYNAPEHYMFVDQRILDLAPLLFDFVRIYKNRTYNIAHWNYTPGLIKKNGNEYYVGDDRLVFFHFSQLENKQALFTRNFYFDISSSDKEIFTQMATAYVSELNSNNQDTIQKIPYLHKDLYKPSRVRFDGLSLPGSRFGRLLGLCHFYKWKFLDSSYKSFVFLVPNESIRKKLKKPMKGLLKKIGLPQN